MIKYDPSRLDPIPFFTEEELCADRRSYADLFVRNYRYTIDNLLGRTEEQLAAVADDERRLQEAWAKRRLK